MPFSCIVLVESDAEEKSRVTHPRGDPRQTCTRLFCASFPAHRATEAATEPGSRRQPRIGDGLHRSERRTGSTFESDAAVAAAPDGPWSLRR
jgi:hypothetical protein